MRNEVTAAKAPLTHSPGRRVLFLDGWRWFAILIVVIGHFTSLSDAGPLDVYVQQRHGWIVLLIGIVIVGYLSFRDVEKPAGLWLNTRWQTWRERAAGQDVRPMLIRSLYAMLLLVPALAIVSAASIVAAQSPPKRPGTRLPYLGINLSGAEYSTIKLKLWRKPAVWPNERVITAFADMGMNIIRLPINYERFQPQPCGPLDAGELAHLDATLALARTRGLVVLVDLHAFGKGYGQPIGPGGKGVRCLADFWGRLGAHLKGDPGVWLGLMNEPHLQTAAEWLPAINGSIAAIRGGGSRQRILISGTRWDDVEKWVGTDNERDIGGHVVDPLNNWVLELHWYPNPWSGPNQHARSADQGVVAFGPVTRWARAHEVKLFLGETGVNSAPVDLALLDRLLSYLEVNRDVWLGATYFAHGGGAAPFSVFVDRKEPSPQTRILMRHLPPAASRVPQR